MRSDLRTALGAIVALCSASCGSGNGSECPHEVVDRSWNVQVSSQQACALAPQTAGYSGTVPCPQACGPGSANTCYLSSDYENAYLAANPNRYAVDGGSPVCPALPDGGSSVTVQCEVTHWEGNATKNCPIAGRRPEGLLSPRPGVAGRAVGAYLAQCAHLEAASVAAFVRLRAELAAHGAPDRLLRRARVAARDEVRHARVTRRLAARFGARTPRPRVMTSRVRPLEAVATENAVEGVVRETFGAAVALWQAQHAGDGEVRRALAAIAEDECRHAELSRRVARWASRRLSPEARMRIRGAMDEAIHQLTREVERDTHPAVCEQLGVPSARDAARLLAMIHLRFWGTY